MRSVGTGVRSNQSLSLSAGSWPTHRTHASLGRIASKHCEVVDIVRTVDDWEAE